MHYKRSIPGRLLLRVTAYLKVIGAEGLNESSPSFYSTPIITVKASRNRTDAGLFPSICNPSKVCHKRCGFCPWPPLMTVALLDRKTIRKHDNNPWRALWSGWSLSGRNHFPLRFQKPVQMQRSQPRWRWSSRIWRAFRDDCFKVSNIHKPPPEWVNCSMKRKKVTRLAVGVAALTSSFFLRWRQFSQILAGDSIWLQRIHTTQEHSSEFC